MCVCACIICFLSISLPFSRLYPVVVTSGELHRAIGISVCVVTAVRAGRRRLMVADISAESASMVFSFTVEKGGAVGSWRQSTIAVGIVKVIRVVRGVVTVAAVHAGVVVVVSARTIVVVHVDSLISFFIVGRHGESSLVRVDVLAATDFATIVAW